MLAFHRKIRFPPKITKISRNIYDDFNVPSELAFIPQEGAISQDVILRGGMPAVVSKKGG